MTSLARMPVLYLPLTPSRVAAAKFSCCRCMQGDLDVCIEGRYPRAIMHISDLAHLQLTPNQCCSATVRSPRYAPFLLHSGPQECDGLNFALLPDRWGAFHRPL
ncbi:hypothetical protein FKP32DRAFT_855877 [Trametes sanguinea]|nr:hypothetical protein FKP32DRAFT_855877 [Trametes sanguinea]